MSETKESLLEKIATKVSKTILSKEKTKLEKAKLEDGTEVEINGEEIFVIADDQRLPAPVGEHTLEDGKVVVVEEEGKIKEIKEAKTSEEGEVDLASEIETLKKEMAELKEAMKPKEELSKEETKKEELSKEEPKEEIEKEEPKVELSKEEPKKVNHSPEKKPEKRINLYSAKKNLSTKGRVYAKLFK